MVSLVLPRRGNSYKFLVINQIKILIGILVFDFEIEIEGGWFCWGISELNIGNHKRSRTFGTKLWTGSGSYLLHFFLTRKASTSGIAKCISNANLPISLNYYYCLLFLLSNFIIFFIFNNTWNKFMTRNTITSVSITNYYFSHLLTNVCKNIKVSYIMKWQDYII